MAWKDTTIHPGTRWVLLPGSTHRACETRQRLDVSKTSPQNKTTQRPGKETS
ncbi:hypothetical protein I79_013850 [Cricetulus griseus]|uniref:Uncharacterized protein n=1 Tax=Cricetulus griseus TaxID=10029 RepID=G3HSL6_CRIGR|nr:hypothetical protein I79_013850 [Cricetulus griseus]